MAAEQPGPAGAADVQHQVVWESAPADMLDDIEVFYNRQCRHHHLSNVSPEAFEQDPL
jgi:hypothetical protein